MGTQAFAFEFCPAEFLGSFGDMGIVKTSIGIAKKSPLHYFKATFVGAVNMLRARACHSQTMVLVLLYPEEADSGWEMMFRGARHPAPFKLDKRLVAGETFTFALSGVHAILEGVLCPQEGHSTYEVNLQRICN